MGGRAHEGVIGWDGVEGYPLGIGDDRRMGIGGKVAGLLVHIDAEDGGMETLVDEASIVEGITPGAAVATTDIKVAIRTKVEVPAVMISCRVELGNQRLLRSRVDEEGLEA